MSECPSHLGATSNRRHKTVAPALRAAAIAAFLLATLTPALAQDEISQNPETAIVKKPKLVPGTLIVPTSSQLNAADKGKRAHTNVRFIVPATSSPMELPPYGGYAYETPASLACLYSVVTPISGCNPNSTTVTSAGGSQTIAIVDAYDDPEAAADLAYFSAQFGLPFSPAKFKVVWATQSGGAPPVDYTGGWELEESLDIEYAHAMAPKATIYLVEAASNYNSDLYFAVKVASNLVACGMTEITDGVVGTCPAGSKGKGEVSMSWGSAEFMAETAYDSFLTTPNVVYFASSGDSPGVSYPCASPNVVCAGGTTTARSNVNGNFLKEITWGDGGGGLSQYEPRPSYQSAVSTIVGTHRGAPDISSDANPNTGVWVYDSFPMDYQYEGSWWIVGGTSVSAPTMAGIVNAAAHFFGSSNLELTSIYANKAVAADFNDITYGYCGFYSGTSAVAGYDLCTGVGSPKGFIGK